MPIDLDTGDGQARPLRELAVNQLSGQVFIDVGKGRRRPGVIHQDMVAVRAVDHH